MTEGTIVAEINTFYTPGGNPLEEVLTPSRRMPVTKHAFWGTASTDCLTCNKPFDHRDHRPARMPVQKPGRSKQDYGTPVALIRAVENRWSPIVVDLAASPENAKAPYYYTEADNSLSKSWHMETEGRLCWLNPPFSNIGPWVEKAAVESALGARIIMLVPASIGSEWFAAHVYGRAGVIGLRPRLLFQGSHAKECNAIVCEACGPGYPKDCMLLLYGVGEEEGFQIWKWTNDTTFRLPPGPPPPPQLTAGAP